MEKSRFSGEIKGGVQADPIHYLTKVRVPRDDVNIAIGSRLPLL